MADVSRIPEDLDAVIHLAAIIPPLADEDPGLARKVNVEGTGLLIDHIERTSPGAFFLYSSSVSVYGDRVENPDIRVTDDLKISEGDEYGQTKLEAESIIQSSNLSWSVFRLAAIMGNHKISRLMFHMPLETSLEICTPEDTARAFVHALSAQDRLEYRIFNLGGGKQCRSSYREFWSVPSIFSDWVDWIFQNRLLRFTTIIVAIWQMVTSWKKSFIFDGIQWILISGRQQIQFLP